MKLRKIKRPGGSFYFDVHLLMEDDFGVWLYAPRGAKWQAAHDKGAIAFDVLLLLSPERNWVAWWVDDPADRRLEIDVCLRPEPQHDGWSYLDLELDPIRHEGGVIEIGDRDEFNVACQNGWIAPGDAAIANETALSLEAALHQRVEPLGNEGWLRLHAVQKQREATPLNSKRVSIPGLGSE